MFDPASFYGHHELDLIPGTFGGFTQEFYDAYHKLIPKAPGFDSRRKLYMLFNFINHWYVNLLVFFISTYNIPPTGIILEPVIDQDQSH